MGKISKFLRFLAFFMMVTVGTRAWSAGYVCAESIAYDSCIDGYYVSDCGASGNWSGQTLTESDLTPGNTCVACPDGYTCTGGLTCPLLNIVKSCPSGQYLSDCGATSNWNGQTLTSALEPGSTCLACPDGYDCTGGMTCPARSGATGSGYVCDTKRYLTCPSGKFLSDCGDTSNWHGQTLGTADLIAGNVCIECPDGAVCNGGAACPIIPDYKFELTTTAGTSSFEFMIGAKGNFVIDWGDGNAEAVINETPTYKSVPHTYATAGTYTIKIAGAATGYSPNNSVAAISFENSAGKIASIDGSLGEIFPTLNNGSVPMFRRTFYGAENLTSIPEKLFDGVTGVVDYMFASTFSRCKALTEIPENLFSGVTGAAEDMFNYTFGGCTGLTEIPADLFSGITGAATYMFSSTFDGCTGLTEIPADLFSGVSGAATGMFSMTFGGCTGLTEIPADLFSGVTGAAFAMFDSTFNSTNITSIPADLFSGVTGAAEDMFAGTFFGCTGLTEIPADLFSGVSGVADQMFNSTFADSGLTSIPDGLFDGVAGAETLPEKMFFQTFRDNTSLTGSAAKMSAAKGGKYLHEIWPMTGSTMKTYAGTNIDNLAYIPTSWGGGGQAITCAAGTYLPANATTCATCPAGSYCDGLTDVAPSTADQGLTTCPAGSYCVAESTEPMACPAGYTNTTGTGLDSAAACFGGYKFTATTTANTSSFSFVIGAKGTFVVDWGDGNVESIIKAETGIESISHTYATAGAYTVKLGGLATGYNSSVTAISFNSNSNLAAIDGSLGAIFPTLDDGSVPRFYSTFGDTNITSIPAELFDGVTGAAERMFLWTFDGCTGLTEIPADLFSGVTGAARGMFSSTFNGCTGLTEIPVGLFDGVYGVETLPDSMFAQTFYNNTSLTGSAAKMSAAKGGQFLHEIWPMDDVTWETYTGATGLENWDYIPLSWGGGGYVMCSGGEYLPKNSDTCQICTAGNYCAGGDLTPSTTADVGLTQCPADSFCPAGASAPTTCASVNDGLYPKSNAGATAATSCYLPLAPNQYFDATTETVKTGCPAGYFCLGANVSADATPVDGMMGATSCKNLGPMYTSDANTVLPAAEETAGAEGVANIKQGMTDAGLDASVAKFGCYANVPAGSYKNGSWAAATLETCPAGTWSGAHRSYMSIATTDAECNACPAGYTSGDATGLTSGADCFGGYQFEIETTDELTGDFSFSMGSVKGNFWVDWGDGEVQEIVRDGFDYQEITHTYTGDAQKRTIRFGGLATEYDTTAWIPGVIKFQNNPYVSKLSGSLGKIFPTLADGSQPVFIGTFVDNANLTEIPAELFDGITGAAYRMFEDTFAGCTSLTEIPDGLFSGVSGAADDMFSRTFQGCTGLTSIPDGLFSGVSGAADDMFMNTFYNCTGLTSIPAGLFSGVDGAADGMFSGTFAGASITSIPAGLFSKVSGTAPSMFDGTFSDCDKLTSVPAGLFGNINGILEPRMFIRTFSNCSELTTVEGNLFGNLTTTSSSEQGFAQMFQDCHKLTTLPTGMFASVTGAPNAAMFVGTFAGNTALTTLPTNMFGGLSGGPALLMFYGTFNGCTSLTSIPEDMFTWLDATAPAAENMFAGTFTDCTSLAGAAPRVSDGRFLHQVWPMEGADMQTYTGTKIDGLTYIPTSWGGGGQTITCAGGQYLPANATTCATCSAGSYCGGLTDVAPSTADQGLTICPAGSYCVAESTEPMACPAGYTSGDATGLTQGADCFGGYKFKIETTDIFAGKFSFTMVSVVGNFWVDWGDDSEPEYISLTDFTGKTITHNYATVGKRTIKFGGLATEYNTAASGWDAGVIKFQGNRYISKLSGSLGKIFPTLSDGSQPGFSGAFSSNVNLTEIPAGLFSGVSGAADYMFDSTFYGCTGLTSIPDGLFSGVTGAANGMFLSTFQDCTGLTEIPAGLFSGVTGAANGMFDATFLGCTNLTSIPDGLFSGVDGAANGMFHSTFLGCTGLSSIPDGLFSGVTGAARDMFSETFSYCTGLTSIPAGLFSGVSGAADYMFARTFQGCTKLSSIPDGLFDGVAGVETLPDYMFYQTFYNNTSLTGSAARMSAAKGGKYLHKIWPMTGATWGTYSGTQIDGLEYIPTSWGGGGQTITCAAGTYLPANATVCATCTTANYCEGGGALEPWPSADLGLSSCATATNNNYTLSDAGATNVNACYLTLAAAKYVETENAAPVSCPAGGYCTGGANIYYGSTGGFTGCGDGKYNDQTGQSAASACKEITAGCWGSSATTACPAYCAENSWSNAGAASCTACDSDYSNSGDSAAAHAGESSCKVTCEAGTVVDTVNAACTVPTGAWYSAEHVVSQGETSGANKQSCPTATQYADKVVSYSNYGHKEKSNCYARFDIDINNGAVDHISCYLRNEEDYGVRTTGVNNCWSYIDALRCDAGYYLSEALHTNKTERWFMNLENAMTGACLPVGAGYWSPADELTRNECPTGYVNGSATASAENQCKITVPAGNYVGSAGATYTACAKGYAKSTTETIAYGETSKCDTCPDDTYADEEGLAACKSCLTNYSTNGGGEKTTAAACRIYCSGGSYLKTANATECVPVGSGNWAAGGYVSQGSISDTLSACPAGLTTIGYGVGADEEGDCGRILNISGEKLYLRSNKKTDLALNVLVDGVVYYGNMSTEDKFISDDATKKLKLDVNGTTYSVYDDSVEN